VIENYTGAVFGSIYVLKSRLNGWVGVWTMLVMWASLVVIFAYWFRAAEFTVCEFAVTQSPECKTAKTTWSLFNEEYEHHNEIYMWDSLWLNIITTLTVSELARTFGMPCLQSCSAFCGKEDSLFEWVVAQAS
jgi:hypothetical protein